jgi:hypothetical protein
MLLGLALGLALGGCGGPPEPPPGARVSLATPSRPGPAPAPAGAAGLLPLPSPNQVGQAVRFGRFDPFAALPQPPSPGPLRPAGAPPPASPAGPSPVSGAGSRPASPAVVAAARRPGPPPLPPLLAELRLTGLIRGGGASYAVVETMGVSGSLRPGDLGGRTTDLLPPGWRVAAVDVARGRLLLQHGRRLLSLDL